MHASCISRSRIQVLPEPGCCQICGEQFVPDHPQLCELAPLIIERFDERLPPFVNPFGSEEDSVIEKRKKTRKPRKRTPRNTATVRT